ncbi:hypothetical protein SAMN05421678_12040 [Actinopolymorpha cephalotaxi]|uniref:Uncharacterized protein n=1 Tax=Actinopolymorpha cephalotaxi TaxID=504797 RepID=A0A1I3AS77_9ACTN|nr:hypothetical protein [Actinopolymorpha cephalotaxi]NYH86026.1 hypothetical protein [Actinopolymorpha cephalotaxi]SFH52589.1 hypothetical protein SAMN05421678_12040 [Actinopolymorpha cephalotaxi]
MRATNRAWGRGLVALAVLVVTAVGTVATTQASAPKSSGIPTGSVVGTSTGTLPDWFPPAWAGDRVRFDLDAHGNPMRTTGSFRVFHGVGTTDQARAEFEGDITCLTVAGPVAIATGVIRHGYAHFPGMDNPDVTGKKVSFTVLDQGGHDRMYWAWEFAHAPVTDCMGLAPLFQPSHGGFRVRTQG